MSGNWLSRALASCPLTEPVEEYLLARGVKEDTVRSEGLTTWKVQDKPVEDPVFAKRYGARGEHLAGKLICPLYSARGTVIGFEARNIEQKQIQAYLLPEAAWNPLWVGARRGVTALWAGGDAWIVEGLFDLAAMEWVIPARDAVLASMRAHLAHQQVRFLKRFCRGRVHLVYDRDETGRRGVLGWTDDQGKKQIGAMEALTRVGLRCRDVSYSGGKDPGVLWDRGGVKGLQAAFQVGG